MKYALIVIIVLPMQAAQQQQQKQIQQQQQKVRTFDKRQEQQRAECRQAFASHPDLQELCEGVAFVAAIRSGALDIQDPKVLAQLRQELQVRHESHAQGAAKVNTPLKEHVRICPLCGSPSSACDADQARLSQGEVLKCGCTACAKK